MRLTYRKWRLATMVLLIAGLVSVLPDRSLAQEVQQGFQNPPKTYRPMVRWWWPGGDVKDEEVRREVQLLDEANFGGAEIQPFNIGLHPQMPADARTRVNDYLTPTFYGHVRAALEEAQKRGMWIDYTFGSGWPFGGGEAITPELASMELRFSHSSVHGPMKLHQKLELPQLPPGPGTMFNKSMGIEETLPDGWRERLERRSRLVAVVAVRGHEGEYDSVDGGLSGIDPQGIVKKSGILEPNTATVLTSHVSADGTLNWDVPEGDWLIFTFRQFPADLRVVGGVGAGPQFVLDHLQREAFAAHAHRVGDSAEQQVGDYFGKSFRAIFCDSLEVVAYIYWTDNFLEEFERRRGYDLTPYLPLLRQPGFSDPYGHPRGGPLYDMRGIGDKVRSDYWQTVSDLFVDNFYQPYADWAAHHNLLSRVQAHGAPADILKIYGLSGVPETEQLYDLGLFDFLKTASSAADVYGRRIVSSESFVFNGDPYINTPEAFKQNADKLITAGINEIIFHGFPYDYMDRPEPGWHPFSPPFPYSSHLNPHNTFWRYMPTINSYITRLQYISQQGTSVVPVAIYRRQLAYDGSGPFQEPEIDTRLMAAGYCFDHVNTDVLLKSHVESKRLVTPGTARFSALVFQDERAIPLPLAEKLREFVQASLPVVFIGETPDTEEGFLDVDTKTPKVQALMAQVLAPGTAARVVPSVAEAVTGMQKTAQPNLTFTGSSSVPFIEKRMGPLDAFFLRNPDGAAKSVDVRFATVASPELWDPWTGRILPLNQFERRGGTVRLHLDLTAYGSKLIVFDPVDRHSPKPARPPTTKSFAALPVGEAGWSFHGVGLGPDGTQITVDRQMPKLQDWKEIDDLKAFSGRGTYQTRFTISGNMMSGNWRLLLNLGEVRDVAEIRLNGRPGPTLLLHPYQADVTGLVTAGENVLEITVVNSLSNAMRARTAAAPLAAGMPHIPTQPQSAGLLGPVTLAGDRPE